MGSNLEKAGALRERERERVALKQGGYYFEISTIGVLKIRD